MGEQRNADRTRARILAAAEQLFARRGFDAASMRELAAAAAVQAATLYHYFPSKEALLREIFRGFYDELAGFYAAFDASLAPGIPLREALAAFARAHRGFLEQRPSFALLFFWEGLRPGAAQAESLKAFARRAGSGLQHLARRWPDAARAQVVHLFLAAVGANTFAQTAAGYARAVAGEGLSVEAQNDALSALFAGAEALEEQLASPGKMA
ncbi:MAG: TetR/AcrR family transcriptional regulator [Planctomycetes bacterium]|nr:TetR/AcrR family transcriptional regulator [Planctomycetota bacterium]